MVFRKGVVAAIKVGGKVLRERNDEVELPFGSEYSVLVKNLLSVRVMAKISIDGEDVTDGRWLIIQPNDKVELERFIRNGNLRAGNKLKFIERTEAVEHTRGVQVEDGIVRIEYLTERVMPPVNINNSWILGSLQQPIAYKFAGPVYDNHYGNATMTSTMGSSGGLRSRSLHASCSSSGVGQVRAMMCAVQQNVQQNDAGITVPGSQSNQQFSEGYWFDTEPQSEVLTLRLIGRVSRALVQKPLLVQQKIQCSTCRKTSHSGAEFCSRCGTSLRLI